MLGGQWSLGIRVIRVIRGCVRRFRFCVLCAFLWPFGMNARITWFRISEAEWPVRQCVGALMRECVSASVCRFVDAAVRRWCVVGTGFPCLGHWDFEI